MPNKRDLALLDENSVDEGNQAPESKVQRLSTPKVEVMIQKYEPVVITLDGNIGAGKSTLMEEMKKQMLDCEVVTEPVGEWLTYIDDEGKSLLQLFYEDKKRWAYTFQNLTILSRLRTIRDVLRTTNKKYIIMERSVLTDRYVFAEMLRDDGDIDSLEYQLYLKWFQQFAAELPLKGMIYLTTGVNTSSTRIAKRDRSGESNIPLDYLEALQGQHEQWLRKTDLPVLTLSTEDGVSPEINIAKIRKYIKDNFSGEEAHIVAKAKEVPIETPAEAGATRTALAVVSI